MVSLCRFRRLPTHPSRTSPLGDAAAHTQRCSRSRRGSVWYLDDASSMRNTNAELVQRSGLFREWPESIWGDLASDWQICKQIPSPNLLTDSSKTDMAVVGGAGIDLGGVWIRIAVGGRAVLFCWHFANKNGLNRERPESIWENIGFQIRKCAEFVGF
jgi:hypothetical protein